MLDAAFTFLIASVGVLCLACAVEIVIGWRFRL